MRRKEEFRLQPADSSVSFRVDQRSDWMRLRFAYEADRTWIDIRVTDPAGRLRFVHLDAESPREALLHSDLAYTSYLAIPGEIAAGAWKLDFPRLQPQGLFTLEWECGEGELPEAIEPLPERDCWADGAYEWERVREEGQRWYRGDFHSHTVLSDGKMTPEATMELAERLGLDFFVATEHNLLPASWPTGKPLAIPGMELTSFGRGDWNALGLKRPLDCWGTDAPDGGMRTQEGQNRLFAEAAAQGALCSINHPMLGRFAWRYPETPLAALDALEVFHYPCILSRAAVQERTLRLWTALWNDGYRITGIGGSDTHYLPTDRTDFSDKPQTIGDPTTHVYAERLSAQAILAAVRQGRVYISRGPELTVSCTVGGKSFTFGDDLTEALNLAADRTVHCQLTVTGAAGCTLRVVENGAEIEAWRIREETQTFDFRFDWRERDYVWRRFDIRHTEEERLVAVTNPFSCGAKRPEMLTWQDLLDKAGIALP
ncbi:CehA/McbA family metallohydrolase [Paenibacillus cymbidii]|uniref:CehA/McbA family metallohydrolase n=1 Tax=Paenibacillus cymbidii TaxID=1639034 RepID=UPI0014366C85|nr:CehA/McbA family metallohydrolase [Paenibacillus cymbidii]